LCEDKDLHKSLKMSFCSIERSLTYAFNQRKIDFVLKNRVPNGPIRQEIKKIIADRGGAPLYCSDLLWIIDSVLSRRELSVLEQVSSESKPKVFFRKAEKETSWNRVDGLYQD